METVGGLERDLKASRSSHKYGDRRNVAPMVEVLRYRLRPLAQKDGATNIPGTLPICRRKKSTDLSTLR